MIPVHDVPAAKPPVFATLAALPAASGTVDPAASLRPLPTPHDPSGLEFGMGALLRFKSLMAAEGQEVHLARMCYDRLYAYERFATAHAGGGDALRSLALELFQIYHRRSLAGALTQ